MTLKTEDFPQADRLHQVGMVAHAVASGQTSDAAIEKYIGLDSADRQGRYYRKAAELLRLIETHDNRSQLTALGDAFTQLDGDEGQWKEFLATLLLDTELFAEIGRHIARAEPTREDLVKFVVGLYPGSPTTARRRASTILSYLTYADLAVFTDGIFRPGPLAGGAFVQRDELHTLPRKGSPHDGKAVVDRLPVEAPAVSEWTRMVEVDGAKLERANFIHRKLVIAKSTFLHSLGFAAKQNRFVDLFSTVDGRVSMYEMKSLAERNFVSQMRRAVAQLHEYRYVCGFERPRMCIVTNRAPSTAEAEYVNYLEKDRKMAYIWTTDFQAFECSRPSSALLGEVSPE